MSKSFEVVLIPFPFTDLTGDKVRPAIVLSSYGDDVLVLFISSKKVKSNLTVNVKFTEKNGLKEDSTIFCTKIATLHKKLIVGVLGQLEEKYKIEVKSKVSKFLGF